MTNMILKIGLISCLMAGSSIVQAISIDVLQDPNNGNAPYNFAALASNLDNFTGSFDTNGGSGFVGGTTGAGFTEISASIIDSQAILTWVKGTSIDASLSLSFGTNVFDGAGRDLSIFFVGAGSHTIDITLFDGTSSSSLSYLNLDPAYTGFCVDINGDEACPENDPDDFGIFVLDVDFADFNFLGSNALTQLKLDIGNGAALPSLVGAYNLNATVVPLPLPIVLFSTGLALLGFVGRKRA